MTDDHHLLGAYALGALDHDDAGRFLEHLSTCSSCETELWQASIAAGALTVLDPTRSRFSMQLHPDAAPRSKDSKNPDPNHPM